MKSTDVLFENRDNTAQKDPGFQKSAELLGEMWDTMTTELPADEEGGPVFRYPRTKAEVQQLREKLAQLDSIGCREESVTKAREGYRLTVAEAEPRSFYGSWKLVAFCIVVVAVSAWMGNPLVKLSHLTPESGARAYQANLSGAKNLSERYEKQLANPSLPAEKRKTIEGAYKNTSQTYREMSAQTVEQYIEARNAQRWANFLKWIPVLLVWLAYPVLYYVSARAPKYVYMRRVTMIEKWRRSWGIIGNVLLNVFDSLMSMPASVTITHWSDGTTTRDSTVGSMMILKICVIILVLGLLFAAYFYILPVIILGNFIMNYGAVAMEKSGGPKAGPGAVGATS